MEIGPFDTLRITDDGAVRIIEHNRPKAMNAIDAVMIDDLAEVFLRTAADDEVKVVVLTGAGKAFSAGADLKQMGGRAAGEPPRVQRHGFPAMLEAMIGFPKPLITAINGVAAGYGVTVAGLADLVFMAQTARVRCPFTALGLVPEMASSYTFPRLMGRQRASWLLMSSEWFDADQCVEMGLAMSSHPDEELMAVALGHAHTLASKPLASLVAAKELIVGPHRQAMSDAALIENRYLDQMTGAPANREALAAFRDRREPDFTGM
ncbi:MAG: enoyl-CoA hydratase-related protein [Acidimicrobiales bacterium]|nr:enoyl-CoA hydratase/isomerase family protein [Acidimicrobiales bacterium]